MTENLNKKEVLTLDAMTDKIIEGALGGKETEALNKNYIKMFLTEHNDVPATYIINFLMRAKLTGADPRLKQIHPTKFFSKKLGHKIMEPILDYNFLIMMAEKQGDYRGMKDWTEVRDIFDPFETDHSKAVKKQLVGLAEVYRKDYEPTKHECVWNEYFNANNPQWRERPHFFIKKCAVAGALRKAFPGSIGGVYIAEEMDLAAIQAEKPKKISSANDKYQAEAIDAEASTIGVEDEVSN